MNKNCENCIWPECEEHGEICQYFDCLDQDAREASITYSYNAPEHDWKCGYPIDNDRYER